jgi:hypothetical protein
LRIQIKGCNRADDEIPSILVIQLACFDRILTRLVAAIILQVEDVLIGSNAEVVIREGPNDRWETRCLDSKRPQIEVLKIGIALGANPWKQGSREAACACLRLLRSECLGWAFASPPQSGLAWLCFLFPLIEPDRQISRIRLSQKTHDVTCDAVCNC